MSSKPSVLVVGRNSMVETMFINNGFKLTNKLEVCDLVQFTGGTDIGTGYYLQGQHPKTQTPDLIRDNDELNIMIRAQDRGVPMAGICRGGQLLWVQNNGELFQHVDRHTTSHDLFRTLDNSLICSVTSTHHQMMKETLATKENGIVLAHGVRTTLREWCTAEDKAVLYYNLVEGDHLRDVDIEVALFKDTKSLCFQPHPEYHGEVAAATRKYYFELIWKWLLNKG